MSFANAVADAKGGEVAWLVLGHRMESVAAEAARYAPVLVVDSPALEKPMAEPIARTIAAVARDRNCPRSQVRDGMCGRVDVLERRAPTSRGAVGRRDGQRCAAR
jgi:hypothetical protein